VIAGANVVAADTTEDAREQFEVMRRLRALSLFTRPDGTKYTEADADALLQSPAGRHVDQMLTHSAVGTPDEVRGHLEAFAKVADADELIVAHQSPAPEQRLRSVSLTAEAMADR
jgi:alkanesulfonate monooxygenase SsuD/methylene tetrahydromethanopterin reductase-like flavin-dependent oxidoreductase (luciferase family)